MVILAALEGDLTANLGNVNAKEEFFKKNIYPSIYLYSIYVYNCQPAAKNSYNSSPKK